MKVAEVIRLSIDTVQTYYQNDLRLFFEYLDEDVLWYGPAKGQFLSGRQAILETWSKEVHSLSFSMGNTRVDHAITSPSSCEVMLSFPVTTHYPSGESILVDQIIHITWCERKFEGNPEKQPRMRVIHISDLYHKHESDTIYPVHFNQVFKGYLPITEAGRQIHFLGVDRADYYVLSNTIQWIESDMTSRHAILHMGNESVEVIATVQAIEKDYPGLFLRCHSCYLVNPVYVTRVKRFNVLLADGNELPIPEKKYTAFKKEMKEYWDKRRPAPPHSSFQPHSRISRRHIDHNTSESV